LEKESGYYVVIKYDQNILDKKVDVNFRKATVIEILDDLLKVINGTLAEKFAYTKNLKEDGGNTKEILEVLQRYFRSLLLQKTIFEGPTLKNYSTEKLVQIIKLTESLISKLSTTNASPKLALEILLMEI